MAQQENTGSDADALKKRLLWRVGIAGVLIVGLIGGLALFEAYNKPEPPPRPIALQPSPAPAPQAPAAPEKPAAPPAEQKGAPAPAEPERTAPPTVPTTPRAGEPLPKAPKAAEAPPAPVTKPAEAPAAKPTEPPAPAKTPEPRQRPTPPAAEPSRPLNGTAGYLVQLGVFNNVMHAEELRAKLTLHGIPSQLETRVLVGPFKSRQEAEAVQGKLKTLGMDAGMLVPKRP